MEQQSGAGQPHLGHSRLDNVKLYLRSLGYEDLARVHQEASPVDNLGPPEMGRPFYMPVTLTLGVVQ